MRGGPSEQAQPNYRMGAALLSLGLILPGCLVVFTVREALLGWTPQTSVLTRAGSVALVLYALLSACAHGIFGLELRQAPEQRPAGRSGAWCGLGACSCLALAGFLRFAGETVGPPEPGLRLSWLGGVLAAVLLMPVYHQAGRVLSGGVPLAISLASGRLAIAGGVVYAAAAGWRLTLEHAVGGALLGDAFRVLYGLLLGGLLLATACQVMDPRAYEDMIVLEGGAEDEPPDERP